MDALVQLWADVAPALVVIVCSVYHHVKEVEGTHGMNTQAPALGTWK